MKIKRFFACACAIALILPFLIGVTPSLQWGDTPLKTKLPPIVITGESTFKIFESRRIPIPSPFLPGGKVRPVIVVSPTAEPTIPEENKRQPTPQTPGCAYRNSITTKVATLFKGAEAYEKRGKYLFLNHRYQEAIETFSHLIETYPESLRLGEANFWIAESYFQMDDIPNATRFYRNTVRKYPSSSYADYATYSLGWIAYRKKAYNEAERLFRNGVLSYPNSPIYDHMLFWLAESYLHENKMNEAEKVFHKVLKNSSDSLLTTPARFEIARIEFIRKDYKNAGITLEDLLKRQPPNSLLPKIYLLKGWCEYFLRNSQALSTFDKVITYPEITVTLKEEAEYGKALSAIQQRRPKLAISLLKILGATSPWYGEVALELAHYYFGKQQYKEAERFCRKIIQSYAKTPFLEKATMIMGNCAYDTKAYASAVEYYTRVVLGKVNHLKPMAMFAKGLSFYQLGRFRDAIDCWEQLLKQYPHFAHAPDARYWLGSAYLNIHHAKPATVLFEQLRGIPNLHARALLQLSEYWFSQQQWQNALKSLKQFLKLYPKNKTYAVYAKGMMGEIYFNLRKYQAAIRWLSSARHSHGILNDREYRAKVTFLLGKIYYRLGNFKQAIAYFHEVALRLPRNSFSDDAQYWQSLSYYSQQSFQAAIQSFKQLLAAFPQSPLRAKALMKLGDCYYNLKDYAKSDAYYQKAAAVGGGSRTIRENAAYGRILSLYQQANFSRFLRESDTFLRRFPNSALSLNVIQLLSEYYERQGNLDREIDLLEGYLKSHHLGHQADTIRLKLARLFAKKGLYDSALVQLRLVSGRSHRNPFSGVAEKEMGDLYFKQKLFHQAIIHYQRYLALGKLPQEMERYVKRQLAIAFIRSNRFRNAKIEVDSGLKSYGLGWAAPLYLQLGQAYQLKKMYRSALQAYKQAANSLDPSIKCHALVSMADIYRKTRKYDKSLKTLLMVRYSYTECRHTSEKALLKLAILFGRKGRKEDARQLLTALTKSHDKKIRRLAKKALNRLH